MNHAMIQENIFHHVRFGIFISIILGICMDYIFHVVEKLDEMIEAKHKFSMSKWQKLREERVIKE